MIIVDTSVWIDFLKGSLAIKPLFKDLLEKRKIVALSVIFGELLQGTRNKREEKIVLRFWDSLPKINENELFIEAGILSNREKLFSRGVGLIDSFILAAAIRADLGIWTFDRKLEEIAKNLTV